MRGITAPYLRWAKTRPRVAYDLAASGLSSVSASELVGDARLADLFDLTGPNDEGLASLCDAIAAHAGVDPACVVTAAGCAGANFLACAALLGAGDEALIESPTYDPLIAAARACGAAVTRFQRRAEDRFALDPDAVRAALTPATRLIIISNPHNPTGVLASPEVLHAIGEAARSRNARVLVDEVYLDALHRSDAARHTPAAARDEVFVSTSSLTKAYGLAGLRCGWAVAAPDVARSVREMRDVVDGTGAYPAEQLSRIAFTRMDHLTMRARAILSANLSIVQSALEHAPELEWIAPDAGTICFPRVKGAIDGSELADRLVRRFDTAVVPGRFFDSPSHIRISFGGKAEVLERGVSNILRALRV